MPIAPNMDYIDLKKLPEEHPLRNAVLGEIHAEFKHIHGDEFRLVEPGHDLGLETYNSISNPWWHRFFDWRAPQ